MSDVLERLKERNKGRTTYEGKVDILFDAEAEIERLKRERDEARNDTAVVDYLQRSAEPGQDVRAVILAEIEKERG